MRVLFVGSDLNEAICSDQVRCFEASVADTTTSGYHALELISQRTYDVICVGHVMGDMDWSAFIRQVCQTSAVPPIIAMPASCGGGFGLAQWFRPEARSLSMPPTFACIPAVDTVLAEVKHS